MADKNKPIRNVLVAWIDEKKTIDDIKFMDDLKLDISTYVAKRIITNLTESGAGSPSSIKATAELRLIIDGRDPADDSTLELLESRVMLLGETKHGATDSVSVQKRTKLNE